MKATRTEPRKLVPAERAKRKWTPEEEYYRRDPEEKPETGWNPICSISAERILQERYEYVG